MPYAAGELGWTRDPAQRPLLVGAGPAAPVAAVQPPRARLRSGWAPAEKVTQGQGPRGEWRPKVPPLLHLEEGAPGGLPAVPRGRAGAQSQAAVLEAEGSALV